MNQFQRESAGAEACLGICTNILDHITNIFSPQGSTTTSCHTSHAALDTTVQDDLTMAGFMTLGIFKKVSNKVYDMIVRLESSEIARGIHLPTLLRSTPSGGQASASHTADLDLLAPSQHVDERSTSRTHVFEHISVGDRSRQILRLSPGERWTAKSLTVGDGAVQLIGTFSDTSMGDCLDRL